MRPSSCATADPKNVFGGKGVLKAINNVNDVIARELKGKTRSTSRQ